MATEGCIYLDNNATTPVDPRVTDALLPYLQRLWGNASSSHAHGRAARAAVTAARKQVATLLGADSVEEIMFTGGATEAANAAIKGAFWATCQDRGVKGEQLHAVTTAVEHAVVLKSLYFLRDHAGLRVTVLPVDSTGRVSVEAVLGALCEDTFMVSVMLAQNETGVLQPVSDIFAAVRGSDVPKERVLLHCDASQALGKVAVKVNDLGADLLNLAGHKMYAPKGVGALYVREGVRLVPLLHGAPHESGRRAGTENVPYVVALGKAAEIVEAELEAGAAHQAEVRAIILDGIQRVVGDAVDMHINSDFSAGAGLPNTLSISFRDVCAATLIASLTDSVACSGGAACHSGTTVISRVLAAMGLEEAFALGTLRISVGRFTTDDDARAAGKLIGRAILKQLGKPVAAEEEGEEEKESSEGEAAAAAVLPATKTTYLDEMYLHSDSATVLAVTTDDDGSVAVVVDQTVFFAQGGGQPTDVGYIVDGSGNRFNVHMVRKLDGVVTHSGTWADGSTAFAVGAAVSCHVDEDVRDWHNRLHSAGHLLDQAMALAGYDLPPAKGYHFPDHPAVTYAGSIPADERADLLPKLRAIMETLVAEDIGTVVKSVEHDRVQDVCGDTMDISFLPADKPVRCVSIAGHRGCPCGGTHVRSTAELAGMTISKVKVKSGKTKISYQVPGKRGD
eukprot:PLAT630.1.p1 GENE.PLAT630.1~~PLAT630.1.p1  ORF type:complete len:678 (-),score=353.44 PLAT630.1:100-2133(-)